MNLCKQALLLLAVSLLLPTAALAQSASQHRLELASWRDPLTPPQGPWVSCSKWAKPWPGSKICIGHKYQWKYMDCKLYANMTTQTPQILLDRAKAAVERAAVKSALAELIKSVSTGGASLATAGVTFTALLKEELAAQSVDAAIDLDQSCGWSSKQ